MPKKKNNQTHCTNPLFLSWLEEWRNDAKEKGLNAQWTYEKAITSLKKYPLPLKCGQEAKILENVGDGIAKKLDKALEQFIQNGGDISLMHAYPTQHVAVARANSKKPTGGPRKRAPQNDSVTGQGCSPLHQAAPKKGKKEYMPKQKTGPFALILTLYRESQDASYKGYLSKEELQRKAELLTEKSFTVAEPGTHYTPWSSMSTLIAKGLVEKTNNPAKYSITDEGRLLGEKLDAVEKANPSFNAPVVSSPPLNMPVQKHLFPSSSCSRSPSDAIESSIQPKSLQPSQAHFDASNSFGNLMHWYVDESGNVSTRKDNSVVKFEENRVWFLIKCEESSLLSSGVVYKLDSTRKTDGRHVFAFLADEHAKEVSIAPAQLQGFISVADAPRTATKKLVNCMPLDSCPKPKRTEGKASSKDEDCASPLFIMDPGSFEIVLCVDQMEVTGGANTNSKRMMLEQLKRINVKMDFRKLQLGDFLWVARDKFQGTKKEVVLDFVIERKRMDDLASSIVDGRFKEQKFRLKSCGLKHPIYLIESYGSMQHMVLPEATLKQAIINSQVTDGLYIRQTGSIHESAAYLSRMTQHLQNIYQNKTIMAYPSEYIKSVKREARFREVIREEMQRLMTFEDYYQITNKNKLLSVREMFAKQLMQLKGISADKATAIVNVYDTPRSLMTSLEKISAVEEKDRLLSELTYGKSKRKIGPMLASQIRMLYSRTKLT